MTSEDPRFTIPGSDDVFKEIAKSDQTITVQTVARRYGKLTTLVSDLITQWT